MSPSVAGQAALASVAAEALIVAMDWIPTPLNRNIRLIPARDRVPSTGSLPRIRNHPVVPDLQHTVIHLAVLTAAALGWRSFLAI